MKTTKSYKTIDVPANLTRREVEIMSLVANGRSNKEIASVLFISLETVKKHIQNIFRKLGAHNKIEALNCIQKIPVEVSFLIN